MVGNESGPGSIAARTEVELDCDYNLRYEYAMQAITAVAGYIDPDNHVVTLIDNIKFTQPKEQ